MLWHPLGYGGITIYKIKVFFNSSSGNRLQEPVLQAGEIFLYHQSKDPLKLRDLAQQLFLGFRGKQQNF